MLMARWARMTSSPCQRQTGNDLTPMCGGLARTYYYSLLRIGSCQLGSYPNVLWSSKDLTYTIICCTWDHATQISWVTWHWAHHAAAKSTEKRLAGASKG